MMSHRAVRSALLFAVVTAGAASAAGGCGGSQARTRTLAEENQGFRCKDRRAAYVVKGGLMGAEQGVAISCEDGQPKMMTYLVSNEGSREEKGGLVRAGDWEEAWKQFEGAGWKYLKDCSNPEADPKDPVYTFAVSDGDTTNTFSCPGREIPFPYDSMRNGLDNLVGLQQ